MGEAKNGPDRRSGWLCRTLSLVGVVGGNYLIPCMCFLVPGVIMLPFCSDLSS